MIQRGFGGLVLGVVLVGCAGASRGGMNAPCSPVEGRLGATDSAALMAGRFAVTMVATAGPAAGSTARAVMDLGRPPEGTPGPAPGARTALVGTTDVAPESLGALRLGRPDSDDPMTPGVAVYEQRAADGSPTVTMRVGSFTTTVPGPNDLIPIEGAYFVLFVRRIGAEGFAGGWASGDGASEARGHFCARRVGATPQR